MADGDPLGEVLIGGAHVTGNLSLWQTALGGYSLCHWTIKPPGKAVLTNLL